MLNISKNSIQSLIEEQRFRCFEKTNMAKEGKLFSRFLFIFFGFLIASMFLPWTQNIRAKGTVTTLRPEQRPQTIHTILPGRLEKWYVREGAFVEKGDTIVFISETKDDYLDPRLVDRTTTQINAKDDASGFYIEKADALAKQVEVLKQAKVVKLLQSRNKIQQTKLKVQSDSADLYAVRVQYEIAEDQFVRQEELYKQGLKSLTDLETRKLKLRESSAKITEYTNKLESSIAELRNTIAELQAVENDYNEKIAKSQSERFSTLSQFSDTEAQVAKLENMKSNYEARVGMYHIRAPQSGYVTKALQVGIGETLKEGTPIVSIMPAEYDLAIEMYVKPLDLPLIQLGEEVMVQFDGWPAIVFSGWPNVSYGTYPGKIFAIDNFTSENNLYRVLVAPDKTQYPWPKALRVGAGAQTITFLNDVSLWYELWRQFNGFPPDFYEIGAAEKKSKQKSNKKEK